MVLAAEEADLLRSMAEEEKTVFMMRITLLLLLLLLLLVGIREHCHDHHPTSFCSLKRSRSSSSHIAGWQMWQIRGRHVLIYDMTCSVMDN